MILERSLAIQAEITAVQAEFTAAQAEVTGRVHKNRPRSLRPSSRKAEIIVKLVHLPSVVWNGNLVKSKSTSAIVDIVLKEYNIPDFHQ